MLPKLFKEDKDRPNGNGLNSVSIFYANTLSMVNN